MYDNIDFEICQVKYQESKKMTETYRNKTIAQIETEFDKLLIDYTAYSISKVTGISQAMFSKVKNGERAFSLEKKIEILEKFYKIDG